MPLINTSFSTWLIKTITLTASLWLAACVGGGSEGAGGAKGVEPTPTEIEPTQAISPANAEELTYAAYQIALFMDKMVLSGYGFLGTRDVDFLEQAYNNFPANPNINHTFFCDEGEIVISGNVGTVNIPGELQIKYDSCASQGWRFNGFATLNLEQIYTYTTEDQSGITKATMTWGIEELNEGFTFQMPNNPSIFNAAGDTSIEYRRNGRPDTAISSSQRLTLIDTNNNRQIFAQNLSNIYPLQDNDTDNIDSDDYYQIDTRAGAYTLNNYGVTVFTSLKTPIDDADAIYISGIDRTRVRFVRDTQPGALGVEPKIISINTIGSIFADHYIRLPLAEVGQPHEDLDRPPILVVPFTEVSMLNDQLKSLDQISFYDEDYDVITLDLDIAPQTFFDQINVNSRNFQSGSTFAIEVSPSSDEPYSAVITASDDTHKTTHNFTIQVSPRS